MNSAYPRQTRTILAALLVLLLQLGSAWAAEQPTFKIGYLPITHSLAVVVADKLTSGKYKNLKPELVKFSSWPELLDAYNSGKIQAASELLVFNCNIF
jgi:NitT/TauT family transport system substrate-binding protein